MMSMMTCQHDDVSDMDPLIRLPVLADCRLFGESFSNLVKFIFFFKSECVKVSMGLYEEFSKN